MKLYVLALFLLIGLVGGTYIYKEGMKAKKEGKVGVSQLDSDVQPSTYDNKQKIIDETAIKTKPINPNKTYTNVDSNDSKD